MRGGSGWQRARYDAIEVGRAGSSGSERQGGGRRAEHSTLMALREEAKMLSGIIKGNQGRSMEMEEAKMLSGIIKGNQGQSREIEGDWRRSMEIAPA